MITVCRASLDRNSNRSTASVTGLVFRKRHRYAWLIVWGVVGWGVSFGAYFAEAAEPNRNLPAANFSEFLARFEGMQGFEARFEEEKTLALLAVPLRSRGRLFFAAPATLLRRVEAPVPSAVLIAGSEVRMLDAKGGEVQRIDLSAQAEVRPLVESMIWIFGGNQHAIERYYEVEYRVIEAVGAEHGPSWQLILTPRSAPLDQLIRSLTLRGVGAGPDRIELVESSGDTTVTRIVEADARRVFRPAEYEQLFGVAAP